MMIRIIPTNSTREILAYWLKCTCSCQSWVCVFTHAHENSEGAFGLTDAESEHSGKTGEQRGKFFLRNPVIEHLIDGGLGGSSGVLVVLIGHGVPLSLLFGPPASVTGFYFTLPKRDWVR